MNTKQLFTLVFIIKCSLFLDFQTCSCNENSLSNLTGGAELDRITRQLGRYAFDRDNEVDFLVNRRFRPRARQSDLCEYLGRNGRVQRRPCFNIDRYRDRYDPRSGRLADPKPSRKAGRKGGRSCRTTDGLLGVCETATFCFTQYNNIRDYTSNRCRLPNGVQGICCPREVRRPSQRNMPIRIPVPYSASQYSTKKNFNKIKIDIKDIESAAVFANQFIEEFIRMEKALVSRGAVQRRGSTESQHQAFFGPFNQTQYNLLKGGFINLVTSIKLKERLKLSNIEARDGLSRYSLDNSNVSIFCIKPPECKPSKYRTADGSCNNLVYPLWAQSNTGYSRLIPPAYHDGLNVPRRSASGQGLPNARLVSVTLATDADASDKRFTLLTMEWGQFMDHDLTLTASQRISTGQGLICCRDMARDGLVMDYHPSCLPIDIATNDQFYSRHRQTCMNFVRSAPTPKEDCVLGYREQMNTLTQVFDASMVYGSDPVRQRHLREFKEGRLRSLTINNEIFMPFDTQNLSIGCAVPAADQARVKCFVGGDVRANENTGLAMLQVLLLREHNRIAGELLKYNPQWTDEIVFQETRRIVAAQIQHISYNEWISIILGRSVMEKYNILPRTSGYTTDYDEHTNPNIVNSFAAAAFRLHTLAQGLIELMDNEGRVTERLQLRNLFNNPKTFFRKGAYDEYLNGYTAEPMQAFDRFFTQDLTNHLFRAQGAGFGLDLIALNIQRGRDHGLPPYNEFRKICGLPPIRQFSDLNKYMDRNSAPIFQRLYKQVDDIDLFIAGNHEKWLPDAVVGPTFACILAEQFRRTKIGDRFWYENGNMPHSFSPEQLYEIRKSSLAGLICQNSDGIQNMQPFALIQPINWNKRIPCSKIAKVNLEAWRGERI